MTTALDRRSGFGCVREIPGFVGYVINDSGTVLSRRKTNVWHVMRGSISKATGYVVITMVDVSGRRVPRLAHRLVLMAFVGDAPIGMQACHRNGVRTDNRISNLRWDTVAGNHHDMHIHGTQPRGDTHAVAVLSSRKVLDIVARVRGGATKREAAAVYGVHESTVSNIMRGVSWSSVTKIQPHRSVIARSKWAQQQVNLHE